MRPHEAAVASLARKSGGKSVSLDPGCLMPNGGSNGLRVGGACMRIGKAPKGAARRR